MAKTAQQMLDAIDDALFDLYTNGAASVSINGRTFTALDIDKLENAKRKYQALVNRESKGMFSVGKFKRMT